MRRIYLLILAALGIFISAQNLRADSSSRIGAGVTYWTMVSDIDSDDIDETGISWMVTYQRQVAALLKLELDLEVFPAGFQGNNEDAYAPQAYVVLGTAIYGAVGVGVLYADNDLAEDPFYALRAGLDLELLPQLYVDLNANYRFAEWSDPDDMEHDIDADTLMLGAALRLKF